jgi:isopenicillin N synthase-like dioxygenase
MLEQYYLRASSQHYSSQLVPEIKPDLHYQVGATPERVEKARNHCTRLESQEGENRAKTECPPLPDDKWRYFWRIGDFPEGKSNYEYPNVVPEDFPNWTETMDNWGSLMLQAIETVVRMFEIANSLPAGLIVDMLKGAPHLLAPTGADLEKFGMGSIFAGFHYDLNFITIHGKSRFPGLYIWLRNGKKVAVKVMDGCLILQAGIMFEKLTGGYVIAGFHEVVYDQATDQAVVRARAEGRPRWRVSSTLFGHLRYNVVISPLVELADKMPDGLEAAQKKYPSQTAEEVVIEELKEISLW